MMLNTKIQGFSKLSQPEKIEVLFKSLNESVPFEIIHNSHHSIPGYRKIIEDLSENVLSSFHLPLSVAPNFLIDQKLYHVPMVVEESSVVAAASSAAKFWQGKGGFSTEILATNKKGHIHFILENGRQILNENWDEIRGLLRTAVKGESHKMEKRGGGVLSLDLVDKSDELESYFQIEVVFETADAMGANFINTCLERMAATLEVYINEKTSLKFQIIMSILSNYTPECKVKCMVECNHIDMDKIDRETPYNIFIDKFEKAIKIAQIDVSRAVTHNKGIYNGIDAVLLATGNDFRAVEAGGHAYAARDGRYASLSDVNTDNGKFIYSLEIPLAVGTVGGVTALHPQCKWALEVLGNPGAKELMSIIASVGLANNFSAIKSLVTKGIQKGHMRMHLNNILNQLNANHEEKNNALDYFKDRSISYSEVEQFILKQR